MPEGIVTVKVKVFDDDGDVMPELAEASDSDDDDDDVRLATTASNAQQPGSRGEGAPGGPVDLGGRTRERYGPVMGSGRPLQQELALKRALNFRCRTMKRS